MHRTARGVHGTPVRRRTLRVTWITLVVLTAAACATPTPVPEVTSDGLQLVKHSKVARLYTRPGANLAPYDSVMLLDCFVAFEKHWREDHWDQAQRVTPKDMDEIKKELSLEFAKVFSKELEKGGYAIVDEPAANVLLVRPALIDLVINAPDTMDAIDEQTFAASAGSMTLYAELYDSHTSALIARVMDRRAATQGGAIMWQNGVTNKAAADQLLRHWARLLRERLDEARSGPSEAAN